MTTLNASIPTATKNARRLGELLGIPSNTQDDTALAPFPSWRNRALAHEPFPLTKVLVRTNIVADCAVTDLEEHYHNPHDRPMDVVHTIPLSAEGAITSFELVAGERFVKGLCKRTAEAQADFESARARGKTAAMVESVRDDVHTISLANVPAKTAIIVRMRIVERLRVDDGRFEFRFPTTISPKCILGDAVGHAGHGTSPDTDRAPDASRLTPPIRLEGGTELDLQVTLAPGATDIASSLTLQAHYANDGTVVLRPATTATCNRDIVIRAWNRTNEPTVRAYTDGERTLVVVDPPAKRRPELESAREAVFVLDRSGSMEGPRLTAAKRALRRALQALGARDTFEIIAFDAELERFAPESVAASNDNITRAAKWLDGIYSRGSTDALRALEASCTQRVAPGRVRTVLFLTDGDVGNDGEIIAITRRLDPATRLFVIGIGMSPSTTFIGRLARLGGGTHLFVQDEDDVEAEIMRFEAAMAGPMACGLGDEGARQHAQRDLFAGRAATFFLDGARTRVNIASSDGRFRGDCAVAGSPIALGALWARDRVMELEDRICMNERVRALVEPEIVALGVTHQIQTRLTSFVAIDEASQVNGEAIEIVQPVERHEAAVMHCYASLSAPICAEAPPVRGFMGFARQILGANQGQGARGASRRAPDPTIDLEQLSRAARHRFQRRNLATEELVGEVSLQEALCIVLICAAEGVSPHAPFMVRASEVLRNHASNARIAELLVIIFEAKYCTPDNDGSTLARMIKLALEITRKSTLQELLA